MSPRGLERRRFQRYRRRIPLGIPAPGLPRRGSRGAGRRAGRAIELVTEDISIGGAYCRSRVPIPLMTRLEISLYLHSPDGRDADPLEPIVVEGCVVRCEPAPSDDPRGGHLLALFFTVISDDDREILQRHIASA